jgi:hypothetical protein
MKGNIMNEERKREMDAPWLFKHASLFKINKPDQPPLVRLRLYSPPGLCHRSNIGCPMRHVDSRGSQHHRLRSHQGKEVETDLKLTMTSLKVVALLFLGLREAWTVALRIHQGKIQCAYPCKCLETSCRTEQIVYCERSSWRCMHCLA